MQSASLQGEADFCRRGILAVALQAGFVLYLLIAVRMPLFPDIESLCFELRFLHNFSVHRDFYERKESLREIREVEVEPEFLILPGLFGQ